MRKYLKSRTVWGAVLAGAAGIVVDHKNPSAWMQAVGLITAAVGIRGAVAANGTGA